MNSHFVLTSRISPPQGRTVMVRSGGLVFSAAFRRSGWALISGSGETSMPNPPEEWWLDDALAKEMGLDIDAIEAERRTLIIWAACFQAGTAGKMPAIIRRASPSCYAAVAADRKAKSVLGFTAELL